jgi:predicted Fe-Mo cluster-binding NifX family protein
MKVCVSSQGDTLDALVDPRFGRCRYFIIAETDTYDFRTFENPNINAQGGAGIQSGQLLADQRVQTVLTGNIGPNAYQTLQAAGFLVITGVSGTIREAIEKFKTGQFSPADGPTTGAHSGVTSAIS